MLIQIINSTQLKEQANYSNLKVLWAYKSVDNEMYFYFLESP